MGRNSAFLHSSLLIEPNLYSPVLHLLGLLPNPEEKQFKNLERGERESERASKDYQGYDGHRESPGGTHPHGHSLKGAAALASSPWIEAASCQPENLLEALCSRAIGALTSPSTHEVMWGECSPHSVASFLSLMQAASSDTSAIEGKGWTSPEELWVSYPWRHWIPGQAACSDGWQLCPWQGVGTGLYSRSLPT